MRIVVGQAFGFTLGLAAACGGSGGGPGGTGGFDGGGASGAKGGSAGVGGMGFGGAVTGGGGNGGSGGMSPSGGTGATTDAADAGAAGSGGEPTTGFPVTCTDAAASKSHFGCEFWPTVTPTMVWSVFDFGLIVANPGTQSADIVVERNGAPVLTDKINGMSTKTLYLPWVKDLKGTDSDGCGGIVASGASVRSNGGAYHVTSSVPVAVSQHSPVEPKGSTGPAGKDWSSCPAASCGLACFSFTADASLLLPTTSLGTTYRAEAPPGWLSTDVGPNLTITGTADTTKVTVTLSLSAAVVAGGGLPAKAGGDIFDLFLDKGDAFVLQAGATNDFSGTLIVADKPIQVIGGASCIEVPDTLQACDHMEEALIPAQALGKHYLVAVPQGPKGDFPGHVVRFIGHVDNTTLTYPGGPPNGAPTTIQGGQLVDLGIVTKDFEVQGSAPFIVVSHLLAGSLVDPTDPIGQQLGDPSAVLAVPIEQYRTTYAVAVPPAYDGGFIEVVMPISATLTVDGVVQTQAPTPLGTSNFGVLNIPSSTTAEVLHLLEADQPFGVEVVGYATYTSYAHPGGMNVATLPQ